ncbi:recombinase family protein [Clostridium perfringens]|uniref:Recombinase family protein n=2 Tax=Clostridium perfringens TaxID=1502 RepID=A0AAP6WQN9_CLOPF|nr:recombinase family protein [Clostridium perfringens]EDT25135.1 putative site-specific recombinase, resolvase family [Clostridium perfringens B str. ATCC 3626]NGU30559.1 recombinase family protein [Clostridium perfringens]WEV05900.1 recombinase family protein [Clostridium perfringens B]WEV08975.1 recombinase family protein [Clostridium perfringens B]
MPRSRKSQMSRLTNNRTIWKVAVYIRLSREDGNDESLSVINQKKILKEYLEEMFEDEYVLVDFYVDDGLTGTDDERESFQRMIKDVKQGKVNCIICKTLARAFRNYSDQGYFLEEFLPLYRTRFICLGSPKFDTYLNPEAITDGLDVPITGLMNDRYAARASADIRRTFNTKRRNGEFIGAFAPYGYKKSPDNKNKLIIDEEAAQVIRDIFRWRVEEGINKLGIVRRLNELGTLTPTKYKHSKGLMLKNPNLDKQDGMWSMNTICTILKNRMYIGDMVQGRQRVISYKVHKTICTPENEWFIVENTHEAIIDKDTYLKAQELDQRGIRMSPKGRNVYLFSGFLRCADCKRSMTKKTNKNKLNDGTVKEYNYYICSTYALKNKSKCSRHSIKLEILEEAVLKAIQIQVAMVENMSEVISEINKQATIVNQSSRLKKQLNEKQKELEKIICVTDNLYMDWKSEEISRNEYARMKSKFEIKAEEIRRIISNIEAEIQSSSKEFGDNDPYLKTFLKYKNIKELNRGILIELIDAIYIHENNEITIQFKFADQYKRLKEFIKDNHFSKN